MGVFKLDLMTLLVIFVVLSVIVTMTAGSKDSDHTSVGQAIPKAPMSSVNKVDVGVVDSTNGFRVAPTVIPQSRFVSKTWN